MKENDIKTAYRGAIAARLIQIQTTTACTLRCKFCGWHYPEFPKTQNEDIGVIVDSLNVIFKLFEHTQELRIAGAEAFLYADFVKLASECAKYERQCDTISVITNGTYIPKPEIIDAMKRMPHSFFVRVDDYGKDISKQARELVSALESNGVEADYRAYYGDSQFAGGWFGGGEIKFISDSSDYLTDVFTRCGCTAITGEYTLWGGRLYGCAQSAVYKALDIIAPPSCDYVDLTTAETLAVKQERLADLARRPYEACKYCKGRDKEKDERYPAAEQWKE
jgi:hypothetical protein